VNTMSISPTDGTYEGMNSVGFGPDADSMLMCVGVATMFCCTLLVVDNGVLVLNCPSSDDSCCKAVVAGISRYGF
jgi:hypothetical protein